MYSLSPKGWPQVCQNVFTIAEKMAASMPKCIHYCPKVGRKCAKMHSLSPKSWLHVRQNAFIIVTKLAASVPNLCTITQNRPQVCQNVFPVAQKLAANAPNHYHPKGGRKEDKMYLPLPKSGPQVCPNIFTIGHKSATTFENKKS